MGQGSATEQESAEPTRHDWAFRSGLPSASPSSTPTGAEYVGYRAQALVGLGLGYTWRPSKAQEP
jgi:hypothetical protein